MHLFAALVPPPEVVAQVEAVVARVREPASRADGRSAGRHRGDGRPARRGLLGSLRRKAEGTPPSESMLVQVPKARMYLPLAKFGNLSQVDAIRLADTLHAQAPEWPAPRLRLGGGAALEWPGDESAWVRLTGDLDELATVARGVPRVAQGLQFFVDRRIFRPLIEVGTINDSTSAAYLEQLVAELDAFESQEWVQTSVMLLIPAEPTPGRPPYRHFHEVPLGHTP